jgi:hypothetical protein
LTQAIIFAIRNFGDLDRRNFGLSRRLTCKGVAVVESGFFVLLFKQFVALLSVFCIVPSNVPNIATANLEPPASPTAQVSEYRSEAVAIARQEPFVARVVQTQIDGLLSDRGIGMRLARTADGVTEFLLGTPSALSRALDNGGLEALPAGLAIYGIRGVQGLEQNTVSLIDALEALSLANLQLLPGARDIPRVAEHAAPRDEFGALGQALLAAPAFFLRTLQGGPEALPAALNGLGQGLIRAAATDARAIVRAISAATQAALALVPGASVKSLKDVTVSVRESAKPGPLEYIVRLPIAVGVGESELARGGMRATTLMVTAVVTAVTDIAGAAFGSRRQSEEAAALVAERPLTLPEAIAKAPVTIRNGAVNAGRELQVGVRRAQAGFNETLRGQTNTEYLRTGELSNSSVAKVGDTPMLAGSDNNANVAKVDAVKPNRPRPVLGAIKAVTGTLKAVRNGIRTTLGLPPRKSPSQPSVEKELAAA